MVHQSPQSVAKSICRISKPVPLPPVKLPLCEPRHVIVQPLNISIGLRRILLSDTASSQLQTWSSVTRVIPSNSLSAACHVCCSRVTQQLSWGGMHLDSGP